MPTTTTKLAFPDPDEEGDGARAKNHEIKGVRRQRRLVEAKRRRALNRSATEPHTRPSRRRDRPSDVRRRSRQIERYLTVRADLRDTPDLHRLARAVLHVARMESEAMQSPVQPGEAGSSEERDD